MSDVVQQMVAAYRPDTTRAYIRALREVLQRLVLLGLWRARFYEHAAFYGGTALRILHGLDRYSEDLDFSLASPRPGFELRPYLAALETELRAFGFDVQASQREAATPRSAIRSAFLKGNTLRQLVAVRAPESLTQTVHRDQVLTIRLEIDTDPPPLFDTEVRYELAPVPFGVRVCVPSDLLAGKMHALLCRRWKTRVKGRDWYDLVWFAAFHPTMHLAHLEARMVQSGHWPADEPLTESSWRRLMAEAIDRLDVDRARKDAEPFVNDLGALALWSRPFFHDVVRRLAAS